MKQKNVDLTEDDDDMFKTKVEGDFDSSSDDDDDDDTHEKGGKHGKDKGKGDSSDDDEDVDEDENNYGKKGITPKARFKNAFDTDLSKKTPSAGDSNADTASSTGSTSAGAHSQSRGNMSVEEETMRARR